MQLVAGKAGNQWQYEPIVDDIQDLVLSAQYSTQPTHSSVLMLLIAHVNPITNNFLMSVNPFPTNVVNITQIYSPWYECIARIAPA